MIAETFRKGASRLYFDLRRIDAINDSLDMLFAHSAEYYYDPSVQFEELKSMLEENLSKLAEILKNDGKKEASLFVKKLQEQRQITEIERSNIQKIITNTKLDIEERYNQILGLLTNKDLMPNFNYLKNSI